MPMTAAACPGMLCVAEGATSACHRTCQCALATGTLHEMASLNAEVGQVWVSAASCLQVLVEGCNENNGITMCSGRSEGFHKLHFPASPLPDASHDARQHQLRSMWRAPGVGDYVEVETLLDQSGRLQGRPVCLSSLTAFHRLRSARDADIWESRMIAVG